MLKKHILDSLFKNFILEPTACQAELLEKLAEYIFKRDSEQIFLIKGYAGTGKTTIVKALQTTLNGLKLNTVLLAPTGRAAKVLSHYTNSSALTIHKKIYRQKSSAADFGTFVLDYNPNENTYFIVDEASMISNEAAENSIFGSGQLLDDLFEYAYSQTGCKLILIGDTAQLPPVGQVLSPALDVDKLNEYQFGVIEVFLSEVLRQSLDSGILFNATLVRQLIDSNSYSASFPKIEIKQFADILRINGTELLDEISNCYSKFGNEETMVICRSNKLANRYNAGIRNSILWREEEISIGDYLMVVKNNYHWVEKIPEIDFIANGEIIEILQIKNFEELYGFRFVNIRARFVDYQNIEIDVKIFLDCLMIETASIPNELLKNFYSAIEQDYLDIPNRKKRYKKIKENPYFNALQVKFAYAITCHKSQGGQWKCIFIDQSYFTNDMLNIEYLRWLYTAITRASEKLYLVNFKDDFFNPSHLS